MRFWQPQEGTGTLSGKRMDEINTANLRDMEKVCRPRILIYFMILSEITCVLQNWMRLEEEITAACKKASVHDFIMSLKKGYDTEVGELGRYPLRR